MSNVIPFPQGLSRPESSSQRRDECWQRLQAAADKLQDANRLCSEAVAGYRQSLGNLGGAVGRLERSMVRYQDALDRIDDQSTRVNHQAHRLASAMDGCLEVVEGRRRPLLPTL